jgi:uncharacterized protein (TIRG00374 family)
MLILVASVVGIGAVTFFGRHSLAAARSALTHPHWPWLGVAVALEIISMGTFARMQRGLLAEGGLRLPMRSAVAIVYSGNAVSVTVPMAGSAMGTSYSYRRFVGQGADSSLAAWALAVAGIFSTCALAGLIGIGGVVSGNIYAGAIGAVTATVSLIPILAALVALRHERSRAGLVRFLAKAVTRWRRFRHGDIEHVTDELEGLIERLTAFNLHRTTGLMIMGFAMANWLADCGVLVAAVATFGAPVPWSRVLVVYAAAIGAASLAVTPAGLGMVEGAIAVALTQAGVHEPASVSAAITYRAVSCWLVLAVGWIAVAAVRRDTPLREQPLPAGQGS